MASRRAFRRRNLLFLLASLASFVIGTTLLWASTLDMPDLTVIRERRVSESTKVYDRTGTVLLFDVYQNAKRTLVPPEEISRNIKNATVAIEDDAFYEHRGIRPFSIVRATLVNVGTRRYTQGGSTITQQVVKNSLLTSEKKISRKLKEWILALKLEAVLTKEEILTLYLNETPYGGSVYGVEEASRTYFGKSAAELSTAEAAYLASLPNAPTFFSPYGSHKDQLEARKNLVLKRMRELGFISEEEYQSAATELVAFKFPEKQGIRAPHFVMFVREYLAERYGEEALTEGGLTVVTTLDARLQEKAEEIVKRFALGNEQKFNAKNAAMVTIDARTGQILTMVGSRDYFDPAIDGNFNVATGKRQPGSALKPFVYATAFRSGYTPETVVFDLETEFSSYCDADGKPLIPENEERCYRPQNYDEKFRGPVTLREALAQSINIPSLKVLYLAGLTDALKLTREMGIESLSEPDRYGLTLVLGGGEVSLLELTGAYATLANGGERNPPVAILSITDKSGVVLESFAPKSVRVLSEDIALTISDILSDEEARRPVFGSRSALYISGRPVAVKTGTTNNYRDAWVVGYTPSVVVGAWAGNNDNSPMEKKVAGFIVAPMWHEFMETLLNDRKVERFKKPVVRDLSGLKPVLRGVWQGGRPYVVDKISGKLATAHTPPETREERVIHEVHSILYWVDKTDPRGPSPGNTAADSQFDHWEQPIRKWALQNLLIDETELVIPKETDPIHTPALAPRVTILSPREGERRSVKEPIKIVVSVSGSFPPTRAHFFINDVFVGSDSTPPFSFTLLPEDLGLNEEAEELSVVVYDLMFNRGEGTVKFFLDL